MRTAVRRASFLLLAALIVTPLAQITMRGVFNVPLAGAEELAKYFLICLTFVAASYATVTGMRWPSSFRNTDFVFTVAGSRARSN